jgi:hypothetical protein
MQRYEYNSRMVLMRLYVVEQSVGLTRVMVLRVVDAMDTR